LSLIESILTLLFRSY